TPCPGRAPLVSPEPTCHPPALTGVSRAEVFPPVQVRIPPPNFATVPDPEIPPPKLVESERLNTRLALSSTSPAIAPLVPPEPICDRKTVVSVPPAEVCVPVDVSSQTPNFATVAAAA